jgi:hypothetical protein
MLVTGKVEEEKMVRVQSGPALAGTREQHDGRCGHRLLSVVPIVSIRVEGGYAGRCLLCGTTGPVRGNGEDARRVVLEQIVRDEQ